MTPIRRSILFLIGFVVLIGVQTASGASDHSVPYIYYYANTIDAIVVERADGTDSRVIAPGAMPADNIIIRDFDWSPSGEWMAWRSDSAAGGRGTKYRGWIARSDSSERLTLLDNLGPTIYKMQWSPTRDLLFVIHVDAAYRKMTFMIIEPAINKIIAQTEYQSPVGFEFGILYAAGWTNDGQAVYFTADTGDAYMVGTLTIDNQVTTRIFTFSIYTPSPFMDVSNGRVFGGSVRYSEENQVVDWTMQDLSSGRQVLLETEPYQNWKSKSRNFRIFWNSQATYALIFAWECPPSDDRYCVPPPTVQVYLMNWEAGTVEPLAEKVKPYENPLLHDTPPQYNQLWSPDGSYAMLQNADNQLFVADADSAEIQPIVDMPALNYWQWVGQADSLILRSISSESLYRYDPASRQAALLSVPLESNAFDFWISPDASALALTNSPSLDSVVPLSGGLPLTWARHSLAAFGGVFTDYRWHPDSQWFTVGERITIASGTGGGPDAMMILNLDGTVRRELGVCWNNGSCVGFVPDRALPHLGKGSPTSVIQQSQYSLPHDGRVSGVAWSPDGKQIASYALSSKYREGGEIFIWDVSGTPKLVMSYQTDFYCDTYPLPCRLDWSANGQTITINDFRQSEVWDVEAGKRIEQRTLSSDDYQLTSSDGQTLFTVGESELTVEHDGKITSLAFDGDIHDIFSADARPTSKYIFAAIYTGRIAVWDGTTKRRLPDLNYYPIDIALSPDGTRLAAAGSSLVTIWDVSDLTKKGQ